MIVNIHQSLTHPVCIRGDRQPFHCANLKKGPPMPRKFSPLLAVLLLSGALPLLAACYTTAGAGEDLQAAGHGITRSAEHNTTYRP